MAAALAGPFPAHCPRTAPASCHNTGRACSTTTGRVGLSPHLEVAGPVAEQLWRIQRQHEGEDALLVPGRHTGQATQGARQRAARAHRCSILSRLLLTPIPAHTQTHRHTQSPHTHSGHVPWLVPRASWFCCTLHTANAASYSCYVSAPLPSCTGIPSAHAHPSLCGGAPNTPLPPPCHSPSGSAHTPAPWAWLT